MAYYGSLSSPPVNAWGYFRALTPDTASGWRWFVQAHDGRRREGVVPTMHGARSMVGKVRRQMGLADAT